MKTFDLNYISKYRNHLMGIAIISIIIFHYGESVGIAINKGLIAYSDMNIVLSIVARLANAMGSIGVEVFLYLSGVGLFYSFNKNKNMKEFYQKRITRVLIPYGLYASIFLIFKDILVLKKGFLFYVLDVLSIEFYLIGDKLFWYIYMTLGLYIIYPAIYYFFKTDENKKYIRLCSFLILYGALLIVLNKYWVLFERFEIVITRVPIFMIGCAMTEDIKNGKKLTLKFAYFCTVAGILLKVLVFVLPHGKILARFVSIPYALGFILFFIFILDFLDRKKIDLKIINVAGLYSLELYLTHVSIRRLFGYIGYGTYNILNYVVVLILSIFISYLFKKTTNKLCKS